jgi:MFS family permease
LGLERNVAVLAASVFGIGLAEELWLVFLPKYLATLGASGGVIGLFASTRDLLDGLYQYPGGWLTDHFGRKRTLVLLTAVAIAGYATYAAAWHWGVVFVGVFLVMAWKSGAFPTTFAVIGDALPPGGRSIAFAVQSILVRVPRIVGAPTGGALIVALGVRAGMRLALAISMLLAGCVLFAQYRGFRSDGPESGRGDPASFTEVWRRMAPRLKRLLVADCLVRIGEGIATSFIVLYVTGPLGLSAARFGVLYAIQQAVSVALYLPMGKLGDLTGRRPMVAATFAFFAAFPLAVRMSETFPALVLAFVIGGTKEMGEPARKSLIVDLSEPAHRGRSVGVYYTVRNLLVVPAGVVGGVLWQRSPALPLEAAFLVAAVGAVVYLITSRRGPRGNSVRRGDASVQSALGRSAPDRPRGAALPGRRCRLGADPCDPRFNRAKQGDAERAPLGGARGSRADGSCPGWRCSRAHHDVVWPPRHARSDGVPVAQLRSRGNGVDRDGAVQGGARSPGVGGRSVDDYRGVHPGVASERALGDLHRCRGDHPRLRSLGFRQQFDPNRFRQRSNYDRV